MSTSKRVRKPKVEELKRYSMKVDGVPGFKPWAASEEYSLGAWVRFADVQDLARRAVEAEKKVARWEACNAKEIEAINQAKNLMAEAQRRLDASESRVQELRRKLAIPDWRHHDRRADEAGERSRIPRAGTEEGVEGDRKA